MIFFAQMFKFDVQTKHVNEKKFQLNPLIQRSYTMHAIKSIERKRIRKMTEDRMQMRQFLDSRSILHESKVAIQFSIG